MITSPSTSMKLTACLHLPSAGLRLTLAILDLSLLPWSDVRILYPGSLTPIFLFTHRWVSIVPSLLFQFDLSVPGSVLRST